MRGEEARRQALEILLHYDSSGSFLGRVMSSKLLDSDLDRRDRALVTELVQGTVRMKKNLDWMLSAFSDRPLDSLDREVIWGLRLGCYQLVYTDVPDHAAINTSVELVKGRGGAPGASLVNAVLRTLARRRGEIQWPEPGEDPAGYLSVRHSYPRWIVDMWISELGYQDTEALCIAGNMPHPVALRCNRLKITRGMLADMIAAKGVEVSASRMVDESLLVSRTGALGELKEHDLGFFTVQDESSTLVGHALKPAAGMAVLDMCAAPGGKATHAAELMRNRGRVLAVDRNPEKLRVVESVAERLGITIVETLEGDAREIEGLVSGEFDRVLIDAPCSGLGTLARKPDVRWRKKAGDIERLAGIQRSLLEEGSKFVKPGGLLVYSTCTISLRETRGAVEPFLEGHPDFEVSDSGRIASEQVTDGRFVVVRPDRHGCDGMFIAKLERSVL